MKLLHYMYVVSVHLLVTFPACSTLPWTLFSFLFGKSLGYGFDHVPHRAEA
jgi:hypothetical protein